jgi:shikimate dehydrogenase
VARSAADPGRLVGHNTDGPGFVAAVRAAGFEPHGARCAVVGAGGAARAVILALARAGATEVVVVNRSTDRAEAAAVLADGAGRVGTFEDLPEADLVVNATSVGMGVDTDAEGPVPFDLALVRPGQHVAELVVFPVRTPLLRHAAARGAVPVDGVGMLVHQAAIAFELWTGETAPVPVMLAAARSHLG